MLTKLKIQNLILVDRAEIAFGEGLNIITGETGSGKSALLSAIQLIAGERADHQLIGKNGDLAIVEASLNNYVSLDEITIPSGPIWIRREIHRSGKSRCFVEDQQVSLSLLRQIVGASIEIVDQSSAATLCSLFEQRAMLDAFAGTIEDAKTMALAFSKEQEEKKRVEELLLAQERRTRDLKWAEEDLALIEEVNWKEGEEEKISQEHRILTHSQELHEKIGQALSSLQAVPLKRSLALLETASHLDASLAEITSSLKSAVLEIEEANRFLSSYLDRLESDPNRLSAIEERISAIEQLKRRFGKTLEEVGTKKTELLATIDRLSHLDDELASLQKTFDQSQKKSIELARRLSEQRKKALIPFANAILAELKSLNLPHAQFSVTCEEKPLSSYGCDEIRFLFSANPGHQPIPLEECASGGELSRLLLAIKTTLAQKEKNSCLVFDEIDSNVGGQTASILGEKLKTISHSKQVICVTHFAQVAQCALHHFAVTKKEQNGLAVTSIAKLTPTQRQAEFARMHGNGLRPMPSEITGASG